MKEINWELLPFLKQEFIAREEKIKINEYKGAIINENKFLNITNISNKPEFNKNLNNIKELFINDFNGDNIIKEEDQENNKNRYEGKLKIKTASRNLFMHFYNIKRFLKKEGYIGFGKQFKNREINVTNGEIDIHFKLEKYKLEYIIFSYYKKKGTFQSFEKFKNLLVNIKRVIEKCE